VPACFFVSFPSGGTGEKLPSRGKYGLSHLLQMFGPRRFVMKNRVSVTIGGRDYTLLAVENESYVRKVAAHVDEKINEMMDAARLSVTDAAIMTAVNVTDDYFKVVETSEHLRSQLKDYLEEASKMKLELSEAKRALFKLQKQS
jgi:cell division protein ZapA